MTLVELRSKNTGRIPGGIVVRRLHKRDGTYYLHVSMKKELEEDEASTSEYGAVLGVDLNRDIFRRHLDRRVPR